MLVVLADAMGKSVGDMYAGAFIPSFILVGLFCVWIFIVSIIWPEKVPALPKEVRTASVGVLFVRCMVSMVPSLVLIFMVLGTILVGLATPTEGGAMGAVGALALAILHRRLTWELLKEGMDTTLKLTTMVMFILVGSTVFSLTFRGVDGDLWVEGMLLSNLPGGVIGFLVFVNVFVFFLAFFLDYFEIAFIIIPLLAPVAAEDGHRPDLVRRADRRQHADLIHASAVRVCAVLSALGRAALDQELGHSVGLDPLGHHHGDHGGAGDPVPRHGLAQHPDFRRASSSASLSRVLRMPRHVDHPARFSQRRGADDRGGLTPAAQIAAQPGRYPPALTGLRGHHEGSFEAAHALAREGRRLPLERTPIEESYDLVVVGGGISGLAAAWFYRRARPRRASSCSTTTTISAAMPSATNSRSMAAASSATAAASRCNRRTALYSPVAKDLLRELGVDIARFETAFERDLYPSLGLSRGMFFNREAFGRDALVTGEPVRRDADEPPAA